VFNPYADSLTHQPFTNENSPDAISASSQGVNQKFERPEVDESQLNSSYTEGALCDQNYDMSKENSFSSKESQPFEI